MTEADWQILGREALLSLQLDVAMRCYSRIKSLRHMDKIYRLQQAVKQGRVRGDQEMLADIKAFLGQYREAAEIYKRNGRIDLGERGLRSDALGLAVCPGP